MTNSEPFLEAAIRETLHHRQAALRGYRVLLFGSRARGGARRSSDFDVGVLGERPLALRTFFEIGDTLEALPTLYQIDWVDLNRASDSLRRQAIQEGRVLYEG